MWQEALYGPRGFYRRAAPADHFATSAQGLGTAGDLLAEALARLAERHGIRRVVEVAAGRGELLSGVARHAPDLELLGVEVVDRPDGLPAHLDWLVSPGGGRLPDELTGLTDTLLVAHEWLDVVPCPVVARSAADHPWHHVEVDRTGAERTGPPAIGADLDWLATHVPDHVGRAEVGLPRDTAYSDLVSRVDRGLVLAVDYGHTRDTRPPGGTLTGYRDGTQVPPVPDGSCDLTAHVAMDSLGADQLRTQREALHELLGPATIPPHDLARTRPTAYLHGLARANALATLTAATGLGGFWWATSRRGREHLG
nr:SAM-dependent methyltransferase [Ornithinimicrobium sp. F0845]